MRKSYETLQEKYHEVSLDKELLEDVKMKFCKFL